MNQSDKRACTVHLVAAARPNFMKIAPLYHQLKASDWCRPLVVHTGQHYDYNMSAAFFEDLGLADPDYHLGVGSGSHGRQTAGVLEAYERVLLDQAPDWVVVAGDVNSTLACALAAVKLHIKVAHLEAGLRSFDRTMPEEINRVLTDQAADLLWTPSPDGDENLLNEGIPAERIERIGNIMIDSFEMMRGKIEARQAWAEMGLTRRGYGVVTLHRPANVDAVETLGPIVEALCAVAQRLPLVFPVHPRTAGPLERFGLGERLAQAGVRLIEPLGYVDFMSLVVAGGLAITDSGGIQEETTYLGIPCLTLRPNTERPVTITHGSNQLVTAEGLVAEADAALDAGTSGKEPPELWDGHTAERAAESLRGHALGGRS